jgi:hypothetical protein
MRWAAGAPRLSTVRRNMTVSSDNAFSLLMKWMSEGIPVIASCDGGGFNLRAPGFISELTPNQVVFSNRNPAAEFMTVTIALTVVVGYEYLDLREAPEEIRTKWGGYLTGTLVVKLRNAVWNFHEMGGDGPR